VPTRSTVTYDRPHVSLVAAFCPPLRISRSVRDRHHRDDVTAGGTGQISGNRGASILGRWRSAEFSPPVTLFGVRPLQ
jgi:hypothetical protein